MTLEQATSTLIGKKLEITSQAIRYHLDELRRDNWIDRNEFPDNPNAYYYFLHPTIDRQIVQTVLRTTSDKLNSTKNMNSESNTLFNQEISKLKATDIELLADICRNPGLPLNELGNNLSCAIQTKTKHLKKLITVKLATREKDPDFEGVRYHYYPIAGLTLEILKRWIN